MSISFIMRHLDKSNKEHNKEVTGSIRNGALREPRNTKNKLNQF